ncbi:hypothetical protein HID58_047537 [Brassica napus]|uniref:Uncharacterized protein n=1 Tax=Brassica napus TaxID=3708 RepID=A0ABQ8AZJ4_BRANA|nr:hypothetical protein HID58_047537 [Brassica napus]
MTSVKTDVDGDVTAENIQIGDQNGGRCHRWFRIVSMDEGRISTESLVFSDATLASPSTVVVVVVEKAMITRSKLAEQLREYQIKSKHDWASVSIFSSSSNFSSSSSRVDVVVFVIWELVILAFLVFSAVSLYLKRLELAFILLCVCLLLFVCTLDFVKSETETALRMGGGGIAYKGVTVQTPKTWHTVAGKGLFWILYRAKQDGPVVMGWRHPWGGHGDHGHGDHQ